MVTMKIRKLIKKIFVASLGIAGGASAISASSILVLEIAGSVDGVVEIELFEELAPNHSTRIKRLSETGAYDNVVFHRVIDGFMAQTGDVQFGKKDSQNLSNAGRGASDLPNLTAEFSSIPFKKGIVGMARSSDPNSANSQFFIMFEDAHWLDEEYTVIGKVISGQDVVDAIKLGTGSSGIVNDPDYISRAYIDTR